MSATGADPPRTDPPDGPHPYFLAIEDVFLELRGSPLQLSPKDWLVARAWYEEGVPLELVERTVRELFARWEREEKDKVWSLRAVKRSVDAAWRRRQKLAAPDVGDPQELDLPSRLHNLAAALPADLAGRESLGERIRALTGDAESIEGGLAEIDSEVMARARQGLDEPLREELERELGAARAALARRLPAAELERAEEGLREEILRRRLRLPVLSLFAPEADP